MEQLFKKPRLNIKSLWVKCKESKITGRIIFFGLGIVSTIWFLIRVIPKPSRVSYPCIKAAAPFMSSFVIYLTSLSVGSIALKKARERLVKAKYLAAMGFALAAVLSFILFSYENSKNIFANDAQYTTNEDYEANQPMGEGRGLNPGRVVWSWDPAATDENCTNEFEHPDRGEDGYFLPKNNNQEVIDAMLANSIKSLAGKSDVAEALDALFTHFNKEKGKPEQGYAEGEKVFVKINQGTGGWMSNDDLSIKTSPDWTLNYYGVAETSPAAMLAMLKVLIDDYDIPQENIYLGDPIAHIFKHTYEYLHNVYPDVQYVDKDDKSDLGRVQLTEPEEPQITWSDKGASMPDAITDKIYTELAEADYLINLAALKAHARAGITTCAKNHFGSHTRGSAEHLHPALTAPENDVPVNTGYGQYRVLTDIIGHEKLGGNTVLFIVDGLWGGTEAVEKPVKWNMKPFNGDFPNSFFISQDQVALESVCFDFLRTEFTDPDAPGKARPHLGAVDDYLEQAANPDKWPADITYDPEGDGTPMPVMGVHEHWDNSNIKQYSKNHNPNNLGIELVKLLGAPKYAIETTVAPTIDGNASDPAWQDKPWNPINNTWIEYGKSVSADDFSGKYKVSWSSETNLLYFLVKITDDVFETGYNYPSSDYPNFDIVEVFIDEDKSGGLHVFDSSDHDGVNAENAFSYHIVPKEKPANDAVVTDKNVCDIAGTGWSDKSIPDYTDHLPDFALTRDGKSYTWEFSLRIHDDTYDHDDPAASIVALVEGKTLGLSVAYCDNDNGGSRDNFFGSVWVPSLNYNDHWRNADWFGVLQLKSATSIQNQPPVLLKPFLDKEINEFDTYIELAGLDTVFSDPEGTPLQYTVDTDPFYAISKIEDGTLSMKVFEDVPDSLPVIVNASDGIYSVADTFYLSPRTTGIQVRKQQDKIRLYPNPTVNNRINIELSGQYFGKVVVQVTGISGKKIMEEQFMKNMHTQVFSLNTSPCGVGVYIARFTFSNGKSISKQFVK